MTRPPDHPSHPHWERVTPDLRGKTVVVVGASGGVGEGVVRTLLADGATVIALGRSQERLARLADRFTEDSGPERLVTVALDATAADLDDQVARLATRFGSFDAVVVSVASWGDQGRKPALSLTDPEWRDLLADNLTVVFRLFRAFAPVTRHSGAILQLNGMSADLAFPGAAGVALSAAATKSLTRTIAAEVGAAGPRFYQLILGVVRTRARQAQGVDNRAWLDGEEVGAHVAALIAETTPLASSTVQYLTSKQDGPYAEGDGQR